MQVDDHARGGSRSSRTPRARRAAGSDEATTTTSAPPAPPPACAVSSRLRCGQLGLDVPQVGADEPLGVDDRVVDPDVEALADAAARRARRWGSRAGRRCPILKLSPSSATRRCWLATTRSTTSRTTRSLVSVVPARSGTSTSLDAGQVLQRAQVLGQAGAAEGEARAQVGRGDVELGVLAEDLHHLAGVDAVDAEDPGHLVGEGDLGGVEGVARVLQRLGGADRRPGARPGRGTRRARSRSAATASSAVPTTTNGGSKKSLDPAALTQELRAHGRADASSRRRLGVGEDGGTTTVVAGARGDGAADDHGVAAGGRRRGHDHGLAQVVQRARHVGEVGARRWAPTACRRRSARRRRRSSAARESVVARSSPAATPSRDELVDAGLDDGAATLRDGLDLARRRRRRRPRRGPAARPAAVTVPT